MLIRVTGDIVALSPPLIVAARADRPDRRHRCAGDPARRLIAAGRAYVVCSTPTARPSPAIPVRRHRRAAAGFAPLRGRRDLRRRHRRRRPGRPVGGARTGQRGFDVLLLEAPRSVAGASGATAARLSTAWPATRKRWSPARPGRRPRVWAMSIEALDLLRERIATHAIDCDWRDGYLGLATARRAKALAAMGRPYRDASTATRSRASRRPPARLDRQPALRRRHPRPALGPPAPAEVHPGAGSGAAAAGRRRLHDTTPVTALERGRHHACTATGRPARPAGAAGRQRLPAAWRRRREPRGSCRSAPTSPAAIR